jgi:hypothetical protein
MLAMAQKEEGPVELNARSWALTATAAFKDRQVCAARERTRQAFSGTGVCNLKALLALVEYDADERRVVQL